MSEKIPKDAHYILNAASSLHRKSGGAFTMEQLEAETGVSRSSIYRCVGSKEDILIRLSQAEGKPYEKLDIRRRILKSAYSVFSRNGLSAATMEQIAEAAQVGVATVYRHFGDKEQLVHAFAEEMTPRSAVRTLALKPGEDIESDLEYLVTDIVSFFHKHRELIRLVFMGNEADRDYLVNLRKDSDSSLNHLARYFKKQKLAGRLQSDAEPEELALALIGMVVSFSVLGPLHFNREMKRPEQISRLIVSIFFKDLKGTKA